MWDSLLEQDPWIQKMRREEREQGHLTGLTEGHLTGLTEGHLIGLTEGHLIGLTEGVQNTVINLLSIRFPAFAQQATASIRRIHSIDDLNHLFAELVTVPNEVAAQRSISAFLPPEQEEPS